MVTWENLDKQESYNIPFKESITIDNIKNNITDLLKKVGLFLCYKSN